MLLTPMTIVCTYSETNKTKLYPSLSYSLVVLDNTYVYVQQSLSIRIYMYCLLLRRRNIIVVLVAKIDRFRKSKHNSSLVDNSNTIL